MEKERHHIHRQFVYSPLVRSNDVYALSLVYLKMWLYHDWLEIKPYYKLLIYLLVKKIFHTRVCFRQYAWTWNDCKENGILPNKEFKKIKVSVQPVSWGK